MQLSHSEIADAEYFEYISQILRRYPQPQLITFEFNETDVLKNFSDMSLMMQSLKAKGANVAVTGVNSGFLTINRILKLPLDAICLEASICENLDEDEMLLSSIEYLASHCNAKRIDLIVPCVATSKQAKQLEAAGVARLEGSWIGKASGHL